MAGGVDLAVERGDADALLAAGEGVVVVARPARVGAAARAPGPQLDALGAVGPAPLDERAARCGQARVEAGLWL